MNRWFDIGYIAHEVLNLTPSESYAHGFENVANMAGGIVDWERDGLPVTTDTSNRLSGSCMCQLKAREDRRHKAVGERKSKL